MAHLTYLVIFHLKMIVYQYINLPPTYGHHLEKHQFVIHNNYQILHMVHKLIPITWNHNV